MTDPTSGAKLLFADEFTGSTLSPKWGTAFWWGGRTMDPNGEKQIYLDDGVTKLGSKTVGIDPYGLSDGVLTISARPTPADLLDETGGYRYTSGMINSHDSFNFKYGYVEIRAQLPEGQGLWPALWMLRQDDGKKGEIDIMEVLGHDPGFLYSTAHHSGTMNKIVRADVPDLSAGFHTYGLDWGAEKTSVYLDGKLMGSIATPDALKQPMYLLANLAVGGDWPGSPDGSTPFPADLKIDYVRVYDHKAGVPTDTPDTPSAPSPAPTPDPVKTPPPAPTPDPVKTPPPAPTPDPVKTPAPSGDLVGGSGPDSLTGTSHADVIDGGPGLDIMKGGKGDDVYIVDHPGERPIEKAGGGDDTVQTGLNQYTLRGFVENLDKTGDGAFHGVGNSLGNDMSGGKNADWLVGGAGSDTLDGGRGNDRLYGGTGGDVLDGGAGTNRLTGAAGADVFVFGTGDGKSTTRVTDFHSDDRLDVSATTLQSFADVTHAAVEVHGGTTLHAGPDTIVLQGVKLADLNAGDFIF
ncbi:family 16 glycosylhydrolase [Alsobacter sp. SYSU M60028]|uniref:Family 16 glycosylhydrolase n=1 Tax=Alsobacter ponti TaxID=2962936 RepID=A0ABT1LGV8_9HYPH|nr:family 16 glycosylhydrolase [Alsobacter ponti]MCP8940727.1 family 16 glycosylhydrolase [Alsobacter ponti]